jgi:hypothetical protein
MDNLVRIQTYSDRNGAEAARSFLQAYGIEAMLVTDDAGGLRPELTLARGVKLLVNAENEAAARDLLRQSDTGNPGGTARPSDEGEPKGFLSGIRKWMKGTELK